MQDRSEEPQQERGEPGSRDTGAETAAGGPVERESGDIGHEETTSAPGADPERRTESTSKPGSGEPVTPPYAERKETANEPEETATGTVDEANVGGATSPTEEQE